MTTFLEIFPTGQSLVCPPIVKHFKHAFELDFEELGLEEGGGGGVTTESFARGCLGDYQSLIS